MTGLGQATAGGWSGAGGDDGFGAHHFVEDGEDAVGVELDEGLVQVEFEDVFMAAELGEAAAAAGELRADDPPSMTSVS